MLDDAFLALVATPVPGDSPGGRNARYDEPFASMELEVAKLDNPAGSEPDWKKIEDAGKEVLRDHSKEVLAAAWIAYAGLRSGRLGQLAVGLAGCRDLLKTFWDTGFPALPRIKARRNALEWLGERAAAAVTPQDVASPQGQEAANRCLAVIEEIEAIARERFEGEDSGLSAIRRLLKESTSRNAPAAGAPPAPAPAAAGGVVLPQSMVGETVNAGGGAPQVIVVQAGPPQNRQEAIDRLEQIADFFQRTEPHSPMGFLLARAVSWNSKTFQEVMLELLRNKDDAQRQVFDDLGLKKPAAK